MRNPLCRTIVPFLLVLAASTAPAWGCTVDFNGDSTVDQADLIRFSTVWKFASQGDFNHDGTVDLADESDFLSAWFANQCSADYDRDNQVYPDVSDIFTFLSTWVPIVGATTASVDCNSDGTADAADFTSYLTAWCTVTGC